MDNREGCHDGKRRPELWLGDRVLLPALPSLLCDFRPSLHTMLRPLRSLLHPSQQSPISTASWNESLSCSTHLPCLADGDTEAQRWGRAGPSRWLSASVAEPSLRPMCQLSSAMLGFGKECEKKGSPHSGYPGGWPLGVLGHSGAGIRVSVCLALPRDSEPTHRGEEEKGHSEAVTHPTRGGRGGRLKVSLRSAPAQLNYSLTRQVQALS